MNTGFRTDLTLQMGTANAMRCMTLAGALQAADRWCHFVRCDHPESLIALTIVDVGVPVDSKG